MNKGNVISLVIVLWCGLVGFMIVLNNISNGVG